MVTADVSFSNDRASSELLLKRVKIVILLKRGGEAGLSWSILPRRFVLFLFLRQIRRNCKIQSCQKSYLRVRY